jgi:hypothetical protein
MKQLVVALPFALIAISLASAADITLKDGRMLRDAVVVGDDAATVTFRHAAGFTQIEKTKLPEPLAAEYPLDAAKAKLEAEQQRQEALARKAEADRLLALRVQLAATAPKPVEEPAYEEPEQDTTSTTAWIDAEFWRLMRARARHRDRDHDRYSDFFNRRDHNQRNDCDNRRDHDRTPPTPQSAPVAMVTTDVHMVPSVHTVPDVHMTADVKMMGVDTPPSSTVPPPADTDQRPQGHRRF